MLERAYTRVGRCLATTAICFLAAATSDAQSKAPRPNIVVIMVDDMGYSDPGCYGGEIDTPHIDQLAGDGLRFTQFYNCSRCCQTRASLLTGAYPYRTGMREFGRTMDTSVPTLAENLQSGGYATAMVGKWHLTELPPTESEEKRIRWMNHEIDLGIPFGDVASYPTRRGFEKFYGIIWGVVNHFDPFSLTEGEEPVATLPEDFYMTDAIAERSRQYIAELSRGDKPFFLYVAYTAPHWPIQAPPELLAEYRGRYSDGWNALRETRFQRQQQLGLISAGTPLGENSAARSDWNRLSESQREYSSAKMAVHAAMVDSVDQSIGRILEQLRTEGELENTLIFFLSDNGASPEIPGPPGYDRYSGTRDGRDALREDLLRRPPNRAKLGTDESYTGIGPTWASAVNAPLRYWKAESYEGGCRTPLIVHWPAGIRAARGSWISSVGHVIDIAPTCYEVAGIIPAAGTLEDGVSLAPALAGKIVAPNRILYFEHGQGGGVRHQNWKAARLSGQDWQLFDLGQDPGETQNLAEINPEKLQELVRAWDQWHEKSVQQEKERQVRAERNQRARRIE